MIITSSLSQGLNTAANGEYSHAEGSNTETSGIYSHAEGENTVTIGKGSHASGYGTIAYTDYQIATGQYNKDKNNIDYFVVGIGQYNSRADGFGVGKTRTYVSTSLLLPNLTKDSNTDILTYNNLTKQVHYSPLSELIIGKTNYATQALTASYAETTKEVKHALTASLANHSQYAKEATTSISSSYSELARKSNQADIAIEAQISLTSLQASSAQYATTASYVESTQYATTASYINLAQQAKTAITASHVDDPDVVKTFNDILKLKPVETLPQILDPGAIVLYNKELYVNMGMIGWKKIMLSNENFY